MLLKILQRKKRNKKQSQINQNCNVEKLKCRLGAKVTEESNQQILKNYKSSYSHQITTDEPFMLQETKQRKTKNKIKEQLQPTVVTFVSESILINKFNCKLGASLFNFILV